MKKATNLFQ